MVDSTFFDFLARESVGDITGKEPLLVFPTPGPRVRLRFSHVPVTDAAARRSKPLPVDAFTGESAELQYEDWLPSLEREAVWNNWCELERFIQLAGYLCGKALQEWNMLLDEESSIFDGAGKSDLTCSGLLPLHPGGAGSYIYFHSEAGESLLCSVRGRQPQAADKARHSHRQLQEGLQHTCI